jgi:hypothetical protein
MVNIFFTNWDPATAARDSCDSYVVKVPVEVATMLSAVHWRTGYQGPVGSGLPLVYDKEDTGRALPAAGPYRDSRVIKSSSEIYRWLVKTRGNYDYAIAYGLELIREHRRRYGGEHITEGVLLWLKEHYPDIPEGPMTKDVGLAMPEKYKNREDPVQSYREYLVHEKSRILKWNRGMMPEWYREMSLSAALSKLEVTTGTETESR